ncbi:hypothetical protein QYM36_004446 [Artemia franciscana]|uniref:Uncharacterized protein n=1 Tax=Artemia franciscana TaxID=6661 RepID=A0AA88L6S3_ARTSF|nr:hypothetical protein QYM36_004446 [Artemia franciscana]
MRPTRRVRHADIVNAHNDIDSDLSELSDFLNSDDEEDDWTPPNVLNQTDYAESYHKVLTKKMIYPMPRRHQLQRCVYKSGKPLYLN